MGLILCAVRVVSRKVGYLFFPVILVLIHIVESWLRHCFTSRKVTGSIPGDVIVFLPIDLILQPKYDPGIDSASNRNEHQEFSWGLKGGRRVRLTTLPSSVSRFSRENVGAQKVHNPMGVHGLLQG
jgi:hypothetical protein